MRPRGFSVSGGWPVRNGRTLLAALTLIAGLVCTLEAQREPAARGRAMQPYREGFEHLRAEAWDKAVAAFHSAVELDPSFEMAYYGLGRAHRGGKRYADAIAALAKCRDLYAAQAGRRFTNTQEAQRYRRDQMMELDDIIRQYQSGPQSMRTAEIVRQLSERKRQLQETINRGTNFTFENTVPSYVSLSLGSAYFRSGRMADAEREYKATVNADPKTGEALSNLAVVYLETGRYDEADKAVKAAEKAGFKVHPGLKDDIRKRKGSGSN
jgi:tetratricopeptide (TPR) repeat protein